MKSYTFETTWTRPIDEHRELEERVFITIRYRVDETNFDPEETISDVDAQATNIEFTRPDGMPSPRRPSPDYLDQAQRQYSARSAYLAALADWRGRRVSAEVV